MSFGAICRHRGARVARGRSRHAVPPALPGRRSSTQAARTRRGRCSPTSSCLRRSWARASSTATRPGPRSAGLALQYVLSLGLGGVGLVLMAGMRAQRATLQLEGRPRRARWRDEDFLTGLGNRRRLMADLERLLVSDSASEHVLALFDLDGFKAYNDSYGHAAGDTLLTRLAHRLDEVIAGPRVRAYRMGGDEFCVLVRRRGRCRARRGRAWLSTALTRAAARASRSRARSVRSSCPVRRGAASEALRHRRPAHVRAEEPRPHVGRASVAPRCCCRCSSRARSRRSATHLDDVTCALRGGRYAARAQRRGDHAAAAGGVAARRRQGGDPRLDPQQARSARRRGVGVHAPPHADRRADPAAPRRRCRAAARLVRSSHERWDGDGYPDGLAGEEIPLGSRIIVGLRRLRRDDVGRGPTATRSRRLRRSPSCAAAPARSSTRAS